VKTWKTQRREETLARAEGYLKKALIDMNTRGATDSESLIVYAIQDILLVLRDK
jgi:hypothetical protein